MNRLLILAIVMLTFSLLVGCLNSCVGDELKKAPVGVNQNLYDIFMLPSVRGSDPGSAVLVTHPPGYLQCSVFNS
jgi:hypothetical protein